LVIGRDYLLKKPSGPSAPKLFLDTQVVPLVANIAGGLEVALDRAAVRTGIRPAVIVAGATGLIGFGLIRLFTHRAAARGSYRI
jgi:threonine dehydrogenase-like Zn-dependent dehydrogenase